MSSDSQPSEVPPQSPFFRALHRDRYERQDHIRRYEERTGRYLIVFYGAFMYDVISPFADAINDVATDSPLDLMLRSPGGDGETALRMARMCRAKRTDFRVIVPDIAASAATLLALAADSIVMSDTSALGPVDPQVFLPSRDDYVAAKDILEIVSDLDSRTKETPEAFEFYAALLADIDAVIYQRAKAAIDRAKELIPEVMSFRHDPPTTPDIERIANSLQSLPLHSCVIGHSKAVDLGLSVEYLSPRDQEWDELWRLHTLYVAGSFQQIIEGRRVSFNIS